MRKLEERPWWPELVELKDVLSLRELGSRYGVAPAAISNALKRSGLSREAAPPGPRDKRDVAYKTAAESALNKVETTAPAPAPVVEAPAPVVEAPAPAPAPAPVVVEPPRRAPAPAPAIISIEPVERRAWRVTIGEQDFVVVAEDIVQAATIARAANKGAVVRVELLGRAIAA